MNRDNSTVTKTRLIRLAVCGQAIGLITTAVFLAIEDAPDLFARVSPWGFILPATAVAAIQFNRPTEFLIRSLTVGMLITFVAIVSIANVAVAAINVAQSFAIPDGLVTPGWQYTQTTSLIVLLVFSIALLINGVFAFRAFRASRAAEIGASRNI